MSERVACSQCGRVLSWSHSEWMRQIEALKAERDEARREAERLRPEAEAVESWRRVAARHESDHAIAQQLRRQADSELAAALAQVERVRALCDEAEADPLYRISRYFDGGRPPAFVDVPGVRRALDGLARSADAGDGQ